MWLNQLLLHAYKSIAAPLVNRCFYEHLLRHTNDYRANTWLGQPILQSPLDLQVIQETIWRIKPTLLIETGTNRGGAAIFYCHLFDLMGHGEVISIDVERMHALEHPRATFLIGSSVDPSIVARVRARVSGVDGPVMVVLDSDHSTPHVLRELELYSPFVTPDSYCLVQDGIVDQLSFYRNVRPGPLRAIQQFLVRSSDFEVDEARCRRFLVTHHPCGWLRRKPGIPSAHG
jgi:cephalosporin hydroxylase